MIVTYHQENQIKYFKEYECLRSTETTNFPQGTTRVINGQLFYIDRIFYHSYCHKKNCFYCQIYWKPYFQDKTFYTHLKSNKHNVNPEDFFKEFFSE